jgi:haloalkane dehalogenase
MPASAADWKSLYPFASHEMRLEGLKYHYLDEGAGPPLLFVHGNPTWSFYWRNLILGLREQYRCVAVDHIGCGLSDKPQDYRYTLSQHIANLKSLVETLDLRDATLVAHDWGGAIGLGTVLELPERFSRIVLFNTGAFPPPFIPWRIGICKTPVFGDIALRGLNGFARLALKMAVEKPLPREVKAGLIAPYDSWAHRIATLRFVQDIALSPRHPTWQVLERIEVGLPSLANRPIQLIWGMKDWCFRPECLERFLKHWPNAQAHRLEDAGHYVVEDAKEEILPLMREFLARTARPAEMKG